MVIKCEKSDKKKEKERRKYMKQLKNEKEIFKEILENYEENIETYEVIIEKTGKKQNHRKLKDEQYESQLNEAIVKTMRENKGLNKDLNIKLKLGWPFNRVINPWIHLYYLDKNAKGRRGRYAGISFDMKNKKVEMWIGFGMTGMRKNQLIEAKEQYCNEYKEMYGNNLERGFAYTSIYVDATIIAKSIPIDEFNNEEFRKDIAYLTNLYINFENRGMVYREETQENTVRVKESEEKYQFKKSETLMGKNILYKGFPGCGKSHEVARRFLMNKKGEKIDENLYERVTFYNEYTNAEFVGTIRPCIKNNIPTYQFMPGPFTTLLKKAIKNRETNFYLIIEEINRGEAASIFGDIFQLLDRENDNGRSQYSITNSLIADYIYKDENRKIYLPENFSIIATMNVSDENVKPFDNAFERRWQDRWIFDSKGSYDDKYIKGMEQITWGKFRKVINDVITSQQGILKNEDKQLGAYFIGESYVTDITEKNNIGREEFLYKVIINLYTKTCKYDKTLMFDEKIKSINEVAKVFLSKDYLYVFKEEIRNALLK